VTAAYERAYRAAIARFDAPAGTWRHRSAF
jgi:hypothetical protein